MKQETTFAHTKFANPFMNASGVHCMTIEDLQELEKSDAGAYITKSCTLEKREGNPSPRYVDLALGSINSMGLPNLGFNYYLDYVLEVQQNHDTPIFFSIAGMSPEENLEMLDSIQKSAFSGITELNLSCPNVPGKPQLAYDFQATEQLLEKVFAFFKNLWVLSFRHILTWHISIKWLIFLTSFPHLRQLCQQCWKCPLYRY